MYIETIPFDSIVTRHIALSFKHISTLRSTNCLFIDAFGFRHNALHFPLSYNKQLALSSIMYIRASPSGAPFDGT